MAWLLFIVVSASVSQSRWAAKTAGISYSRGVPAIAKAIAIAPQKKKEIYKTKWRNKKKTEIQTDVKKSKGATHASGKSNGQATDLIYPSSSGFFSGQLRRVWPHTFPVFACFPTLISLAFRISSSAS